MEVIKPFNMDSVRRLSQSVRQSIGDVTATTLSAGVVLLIAAGVVRLIGSQLTASYLALFAVGLVLILIAAATSYDTIKSNLGSRKGFYGFNTTAMILLFLGLAALIIFIGSSNNGRFDVTAGQDFSLARQTTDILNDLEGEVEAVFFLDPTDINQVAIRGRAQDLLEEYRQASDNFTYRIVDPDIEPEEARRFGINPDTDPGTVVFASGDSLQAVNTLFFQSQGGGFFPNINMERDYSQAILAVTQALQKTVYFLDRHGERDPNAPPSEGNGYTLAQLGLTGDNYQVRTLDLASAGEVPQDAAILVIAGPQRDLQEQEIEPLDNWLRQGGKALFLLDPGTPQTFRDLIKTWGVDIGEGTIVDISSSLANNPRAPLIERRGYSALAPNLVSPITRPITDSTFFERATAVIPIENQVPDPTDPNAPVPIAYVTDEILVTPLAVTTAFFSWLGTDPSDHTFNAGEKRGPLAVGASVEARAPFKETPPADPNAQRTQIVVFGDSDFASNRFITSFGNQDIFLNSVNWLAGDVELISVRSKIAIPRLLVVTQSTFNFIRWSSILLLPLAVLAGGVFVWWRRR